jgi:hypothetical protein
MLGTLNHMEPNPYLLANFSGLWAAWDNLTLNIDSWNGSLPWVKTLIGAVIIVSAACLIVPCLVP